MTYSTLCRVCELSRARQPGCVGGQLPRQWHRARANGLHMHHDLRGRVLWGECNAHLQPDGALGRSGAELHKYEQALYLVNFLNVFGHIVLRHTVVIPHWTNKLLLTDKLEWL